MRLSGWMWLFAASAGTQLVQTLLDRDLVPYTGTLATAALIGHAVTRRALHRLVLAGLVALTAGAASVDHHYDGFGWPRAFGAGSGPIAANLVAVAVLLLAVASLARTGPAARRAPTAVAAVLATAGGGFVAFAGPAQDRPVQAAVFVVLPLVALVTGVHATDAALGPGRTRRAGGLAMLPVVVLALGAAGATGALDGAPGLAAPRDYCSAVTFGDGLGATPRPTATDWTCGPAPDTTTYGADVVVAVGQPLGGGATAEAEVCPGWPARSFHSAWPGSATATAGTEVRGAELIADELIVDCADPRSDVHAYSWRSAPTPAPSWPGTVTWQVDPWRDLPGVPGTWPFLVALAILTGLAALTRTVLEP